MTLANLSIPQQYTLDIEPEGRLTLPKEIQTMLNLESGDRLILTLEDNGKLQLVSLKQQVKKLRGLLTYYRTQTEVFK
jgi:AbrB family looped-hinge helix DNA binding protein